MVLGLQHQETPSINYSSGYIITYYLALYLFTSEISLALSTSIILATLYFLFSIFRNQTSKVPLNCSYKICLFSMKIHYHVCCLSRNEKYWMRNTNTILISNVIWEISRLSMDIISTIHPTLLNFFTPQFQ